jgi:hypothetical protein
LCGAPSGSFRRISRIALSRPEIGTMRCRFVLVFDASSTSSGRGQVRRTCAHCSDSSSPLRQPVSSAASTIERRRSPQAPSTWPPDAQAALWRRSVRKRYAVIFLTGNFRELARRCGLPHHRRPHANTPADPARQVPGLRCDGSGRLQQRRADRDLPLPMRDTVHASNREGVTGSESSLSRCRSSVGQKC